MKRSLKSQAPFVQLVVLGCLTVMFAFIGFLVVQPLITNGFHISKQDLLTSDYSKPGFTNAMRVLLGTMSVFVFLLPSLVFAYFSDQRPLRFIGFRKPVPMSFLFMAILIFACSIPLISWLAEMNQHIHFSETFKNLETQIRRAETEATALEKHLLAMNSPGELLLMVVIMAVIPGFVEEIFFRGILQRIFIEVTGRPWIGIIITAITFSAVHGQFLGFFPRAMLGVILGALFWFSGSIWPNILAHFIFNGMQIVLLYNNPKFDDGATGFSSTVLGLSAISVTAIFWWMIRSSQTSYEEIYDTDDDFIIGRRDQYSS